MLDTGLIFSDAHCGRLRITGALLGRGRVQHPHFALVLSRELPLLVLELHDAVPPAKCRHTANATELVATCVSINA